MKHRKSKKQVKLSSYQNVAKSTKAETKSTTHASRPAKLYFPSSQIGSVVGKGWQMVV
jgi:hypothetical protein